jgi:hypothetical protein
MAKPEAWRTGQYFSPHVSTAAPNVTYGRRKRAVEVAVRYREPHAGREVVWNI